MVVGVRVEAENIQTGTCTHCNSSYFTMVAKDKDGNKAEIPGIILETKDNVRRYMRSIARRIQAIKRETTFDENEFKITEDVLEELNNHNMKLGESLK